MEEQRLPTDNDAAMLLRIIEDKCRDEIEGWKVWRYGFAGDILEIVHDYWMGDRPLPSEKRNFLILPREKK